MENKFFLILLILIIECNSKPEFQSFIIKVDFSYLNTEDLYIKKLMRIEFDKITKYFKNLFQYPNYSYLYKENKKNTERILKCNNTDIELKYDKESIDKKTFLVIFPRIII